MLAIDCKCLDCGKQAVCFWPIIDPDISENPYCRKCVEKRKDKLTFNILELGKKRLGKSENID